MGFAAPFLMGVMLMASALASQYEDDQITNSFEQPSTKEAEVQTNPAPKPRCPDQDPLDAEILRILKGSPTPLTVKQITAAFPGSEKRALNSRLYKMLSQKKISQWKTSGAPLWIA